MTESEINFEQVLLELGRALYVFQSIEARLKCVLPHLCPSGTDTTAVGEGWGNWRKYLDSKEMLGNLVKLFQQRILVGDPELIENEWHSVVQGRNDVVHNFIFQPFAKCATLEEQRLSIEYIRTRRLRAHPFFQMLDSLLHGLRAVAQLPPDFEGEATIELPAW